MIGQLSHNRMTWPRSLIDQSNLQGKSMGWNAWNKPIKKHVHQNKIKTLGDLQGSKVSFNGTSQLKIQFCFNPIKLLVLYS